MQQKGRTEQILDRLQEMINNGQGALTPGKVSLPKEELSRLILELSLTMETELKQYREITDKRAKVLKEAKKQADDIIYEAEQSASRIRVSGRKTDVAPVRMKDLSETERRSLDNANEIYAASLIYTDEMMAEMQDVIEDAYEKITASYEHAIADLKEKSEIIAANRQELMSDLKSMEKEDRYQQIMEIGQLLSEELYHARKMRMGEDGIVQNTAADTEQQEAVKAEAEQKEGAAAPVGVVEAMKQAAKAAKQTEQADIETEQPDKTAETKQPEEEPAMQQAETVQQTEDVKHQEDIQQAGNIIAMDPAMQQDVALAVASALEEKKRAEMAVEEKIIESPVEDKKIDVAEITEEVSEAVKRDPQPSLSTSVIEAMKRAAKKAVLGMEGDEDDMLAGEYDEEDEDEEYAQTYRTPTQPLDTQEINRRAEHTATVQPMTPEQIKEERHRDFVEAHEERVRAEEEKWLNAVYNPVIPDANAVDPIVAMVLQEKEAARKHDI